MAIAEGTQGLLKQTMRTKQVSMEHLMAALNLQKEGKLSVLCIPQQFTLKVGPSSGLWGHMLSQGYNILQGHTPTIRQPDLMANTPPVMTAT